MDVPKTVLDDVASVDSSSLDSSMMYRQFFSMGMIIATGLSTMDIFWETKTNLNTNLTIYYNLIYFLLTRKCFSFFIWQEMKYMNRTDREDSKAGSSKDAGFKNCSNNMTY